MRLFTAFNLGTPAPRCIIFISMHCLLHVPHCVVSLNSHHYHKVLQHIESRANDSVLLDDVEYYTIASKCIGLYCFRTPKRMRVARSCGHSMYMYSIGLFSINVRSLYLSREGRNELSVLLGDPCFNGYKRHIVISTNLVNQNANPVFGASFFFYDSHHCIMHHLMSEINMV